MAVVGTLVVILAIFALIVLFSAIKILREYERGVIFRLGRLINQKGPGLILLIPFIDRMVKIDLRTVTLNIPPQEVITRDNVPTSVNAVCYFRVVDPNRAITDVENYLIATSQIAQTSLRAVLGKAELDEILSERERLNESLQKIIDEQTEPWGVKVTTVEIKDVEIPEAMQRAMARQAEAERERRAKIINSEGEYQAAEKLTDMMTRAILQSASRPRGVLEIQTEPAGASVFVDGTELGITPYKRPAFVGNHKVVLQHVGYHSEQFEAKVGETGRNRTDKTLVAGTDPVKVVVVEKEKTPVYKKWWFWVAIGGAAVAAAAITAGVVVGTGAAGGGERTIPANTYMFTF